MMNPWIVLFVVLRGSFSVQVFWQRLGVMSTTRSPVRSGVSASKPPNGSVKVIFLSSEAARRRVYLVLFEERQIGVVRLLYPDP